VDNQSITADIQSEHLTPTSFDEGGVIVFRLIKLHIGFELSVSTGFMSRWLQYEGQPHEEKFIAYGCVNYVFHERGMLAIKLSPKTMIPRWSWYYCCEASVASEAAHYFSLTVNLRVPCVARYYWIAKSTLCSLFGAIDKFYGVPIDQRLSTKTKRDVSWICLERFSHVFMGGIFRSCEYLSG